MITAILAGLRKQSASAPDNTPLYIHIAGLAIVNDNARGEFVEEEKIPRYSDIGFNLDQIPPGAIHLDCDKIIVEAGVQKENAVHTILAYPAMIYGVGEGECLFCLHRRLPTFSQVLRRRPLRFKDMWRFQSQLNMREHGDQDTIRVVGST